MAADWAFDCPVDSSASSATGATLANFNPIDTLTLPTVPSWVTYTTNPAGDVLSCGAMSYSDYA